MADDLDLDVDTTPSSSPSPLLAAARALSGQADEKPTAQADDGSDAGDETDETPPAETAEEPEVRTAAEEPAPEEGEGEGEKPAEEAGEEAPEGEAEKTVEAVLPPLPGREKGGPDSASLVIEGVTDEFRDRIAAHVDRSLKLDRITEQRDRLEERTDQYESTVAYLDHAIEKGDRGVMFWLESQNVKLGAEFAHNWMERHPIEAMKILVDELKLDKETDAEKLSLRADKAQREAEDSLRKSFTEVSASRQMQRYTSRADGVFNDVVERVAQDDRKIFAKLANAELTDLWQTHAKAGQRPPTNTEIRAALDPLVVRLTGKQPTKAAAGPTGKPSQPKSVKAGDDLLERAARTPAEYQEKLKRAKGLRAAGAGATAGITSYLRAGGLKRVKAAPGQTPLDATIKAMQRGKL